MLHEVRIWFFQVLAERYGDRSKVLFIRWRM